MKFDPNAFIQRRFPFLEVQEVMLLLKSSRMVNLKAGENFIESGEVNYKTGFIIKGLLRGYRVTPEGEEKNVLFRKEMEVIGALQSMVRNEAALETVEALEDSWIYVFDFKRFKELTKQNPRILRAYTRLLETMLLEAVDRIYEFTMDSPEKRYLHFVEQYGGLVQRLPLKHLASYLGITPYSLSRIRKRISLK